MSSSSRPHIAGLYEVCIGVQSQAQHDEVCAFYALQGYTKACEGQLGAADAKDLYGVDSALHSTRLGHQDADHGLVRVFLWDKPTGPGLGLSPLKTLGARWTASLTADVTNVANHALIAQRLQASSREPQQVFLEPQWGTIYHPSDGLKPFERPLIGVREMVLLRPLTRHVFFQRFGYTVPEYGKVADSSMLRTSQATHFGLVVQAESNEAVIAFYSGVLGLLKAREDKDDEPTTYQGSEDAATVIWGLRPGERHWCIDFDDPRSSAEDYRLARSGRLKIARFEPPAATSGSDGDADSGLLRPGMHLTNPGNLGMSLYTYRSADLDALRSRVIDGGGTNVTDAMPNEFGEESFSFKSPDGYAWNILRC